MSGYWLSSHNFSVSTIGSCVVESSAVLLRISQGSLVVVCSGHSGCDHLHFSEILPVAL